MAVRMEARISPRIASKAVSESRAGCSMYMRPAWKVTPGGAMRLKSCSTTVFVEGTMTPILARQPTMSGTGGLLLLLLLVAGQRIHHVRRGEVERPDGRVDALLDLLHDGADARVLPLLVEAHPRPRHDQLIGGDIGGHQRLADVLRVRRLGAVDGVDEHGEAGQRPRGRLGDVAAARIVLLLLEELVDLADERLLGLEIQREGGARDVSLDVALHLLHESGVDPPRVLGDEHLGHVVEGLG